MHYFFSRPATDGARVYLTITARNDGHLVALSGLFYALFSHRLIQWIALLLEARASEQLILRT
jgi:hypothetical protein